MEYHTFPGIILMFKFHSSYEDEVRYYLFSGSEKDVKYFA